MDGIWLHNDQGQSQYITLGETVPLYETVRNDDQARLDQVSPPGTGSQEVPLYGARYGPARALRAVELNSLTKACAGERADHNDNKLSDIAEWGRPPLTQAPVSSGSFPPAMLHWFEVYTRYSYFVELDRGWYEAGPAGEPGSYHIAEKDRSPGSGSGFPLRYGREASGLFTSDRWQDCPRARDAWYSDSLPAIGMDFASLSGPSRGWKGMTHHSQFKCVKVVDDAAYASVATSRPANRHVQSLLALGDPVVTPAVESSKDFLRAMVNTCVAPFEAGSVAGVGKNPADPIITCQASLPDEKHVGGVFWAAVRIAETSRYYRGCILQCDGFPFVCPGTDPANPVPQACYHVCADTAGSETKVYELLRDGIPHRLRVEVPIVVADKPLGDEAAGYRIVPR